MITLPDRLRSIRKAKGLTQAQLAKLSGVDQSHISRLEKGEKGVSTEGLQSLAGSLGVTISELVGDHFNLIATEFSSNSQARQILSDEEVPQGLREFAVDRPLVDALKVTEAEWKALRSIELPSPINKDGYVNILICIRAVSPTPVV